MSDFTGKYDQFYNECRSGGKGNAFKCDLIDCDRLAVYVYDSRRLCVDHYRKLKG